MRQSTTFIVISILALALIISACSNIPPNTGAGNNNVPKQSTANNNVPANPAAQPAAAALDTATASDIASDIEITPPVETGTLYEINVSDEIPQ